MVTLQEAFDRAYLPGTGAYFMPLSGFERRALVELAIAAGTSPDIRASDMDLITLFNVAKRKLDSAREVALKINRKYTGSQHVPAGLAPDPVQGDPAPFTPVNIQRDPTPEPSGFTHEDIADIVREVLEPLGDRLDTLDGHVHQLRESVKQAAIEAVQEALTAATPTQLVVTIATHEPVTLGLVHFKTGDVIKALAAGHNVYLHGPAGSGKTTVAIKCAEALDIPFYFAAKVESEYLLLGFRDATGGVVRTPFRDAYEHGGVFLLDELDGSSPSAVVALNAALANGICPFPDGMVKRHENFRCIGAGNTVLTGSSRQYTGRMQLDAASVDRFAFIEFPYDEQLELALSTNHTWAKHVQAIRRAIAERGLQHLVTPRASYDGCKSLAAGFQWEECETMHVFKGLDQDTVDQIKREVRRAGDPLIPAVAPRGMV